MLDESSYNVWIFVSMLLSLQSVSSTRGNSDVCKEVSSCKCSSGKLYRAGGYTVAVVHAQCQEPNESDLRNLLKRDVESLVLFNGTHNGTIAALQLLRETNASTKRISLRSTQLRSLDISILPEYIENLILHNNVLLQEVTSTDCVRDKKLLKRLATLKILLDYSDSPRLKCLPNGLRYLRIIRVTSLMPIYWPQYLRYFKLSDIRNGYPTNTLTQVGPNLRSFHIAYANVENGIMPKIVGNENISYISLQYSNISFLGRDAFLHLRNLTWLDLAGNVLTTFNVILPPTLKLLILRNNKIQRVNGSSITKTQLIYIALQDNDLTSCPLHLPKTVQRLMLNRNKIETCSPEAFAGLVNLTQLDLSRNRLKVMPSGIVSKLVSYKIHSNLLSRIHGPENYEFCSECRMIEIGRNRWFCDIKFFKFLLWLREIMDRQRRADDLYTYPGRCGNLPKYAFTANYLQEVADYTKYISSPPYGSCRYEPQQLLNCTKANLKLFPNAPPQGLKSVIVVKNSELTETPDFVFANQQYLTRIILSFNNLKRIPFGLPSSVEVLDLSENNVTELTAKDVLAFSNLTNLRSLFLHENHIKTVTSQDFAALKNLRWLGLEGNDLVCDCSLFSFTIWFEKLNEQHPSDNFLIRFAKCMNPPQQRHRDVRHLFYHYEYDLKCISPLCASNDESMELNCSIHNQKNSERMLLHALPGPIYGKFPVIASKSYWKKLYLDGLHLKDKDVNMREFVDLIHADLSNNFLTEWPLTKLPSSLKELILRGNKITNIPKLDLVTKYQPHLETVDLRENMIKTISPQQTATLLSLKGFYMDGNPFECTCSLVAFNLWAKVNATANTHKSDANVLRCSGPSNLANEKLATLTEQDMCKRLISIDVKIWVSVALFMAVICLSMIVTIQVLRKRRYRKQILAGFQRLLQQDAAYVSINKDGSIPMISSEKSYNFDAFIATEDCADDGEFVEKFIEELEQRRRFKLCISTRDFVSGMDISDNIIESITSSKRVILVVSKTFIASPWCQYKVQVALAELHKRQQKLLIPILLEDLEGSHSNLKTFLSLIPTFRAPSEKSSKKEWQKFWNTISDAI